MDEDHRIVVVGALSAATIARFLAERGHDSTPLVIIDSLPKETDDFMQRGMRRSAQYIIEETKSIEADLETRYLPRERTHPTNPAKAHRQKPPRKRSK